MYLYSKGHSSEINSKHHNGETGEAFSFKFETRGNLVYDKGIISKMR